LALVTIQLSPEAEALIRELIERGDYEDPETVVDEALSALLARDHYSHLKTAIAVGMEQYERGEMIPWTPDYFDRLKREAAELARSGKPIKDEVKP